MQRFALVALLSMLLVVPIARKAIETPEARAHCIPEGRGDEVKGWLGCAGDGGQPREFASAERILLGLPLDPNRADEQSLAFVPGFSRGIAAEVVREREMNGPFRSPDDLLRVHGIGRKRLSRALPMLRIESRSE